MFVRLRMSQLTRPIVVIGGFALLVASCAPAPPPAEPAPPPEEPAAPVEHSPALAEVIQAANEEGALVIQWLGGRFGDHAGVGAMVDAMNRRYGTDITLDFTPGPAFAEMLTRVTEEWQAGHPASSDILLGTSLHTTAGLESGLLRNVDWASVLERPAPPDADIERIATDGVGVAMVSRVVGIPYNTDLVAGDDVPRSMEDVFDPKWTGRIASTPFATGLYQFAADDMLGYEYMRDYTERLAGQIGGLITCADIDRIASGEFAMLVFDCGHDDVLRFQQRGAPVDHAVVEEISHINIVYFGIPDNARNPNAAILFTNFLHTEEGQRLAWEHGGHDLHIYPEAETGPMVQSVVDAGGKLALHTVQRELELGHEEVTRVREEFVQILRGGS